ncbi:jg18501 [Pararge aegeria aegeria]|uniref:Jg18501 protein n=1 Tax=Pararge aegeria aegeria TaxID=348720 RepID=A0A8S4QI70_9NEOP|nr:jg18501 [Pararge aegeria aegeria]
MNYGISSVERSGFAAPQLLSSGAIIGLALAGVFICLIIVDLLLLCFRRQGVIASICGRRVKKHSDDEAKLGRDEKEPLKDTGDEGIKRNSSVEFDGRRVYATSGVP